MTRPKFIVILLLWLQLQGLCNVTIRELQFKNYPAHVKKRKNYAFKPVIIAVSDNMPLIITIKHVL